MPVLVRRLRKSNSVISIGWLRCVVFLIHWSWLSHGYTISTVEYMDRFGVPRFSFFLQWTLQPTYYIKRLQTPMRNFVGISYFVKWEGKLFRGKVFWMLCIFFFFKGKCLWLCGEYAIECEYIAFKMYSAIVYCIHMTDPLHWKT